MNDKDFIGSKRLYFHFSRLQVDFGHRLYCGFCGGVNQLSMGNVVNDQGGIPMCALDTIVAQRERPIDKVIHRVPTDTKPVVCSFL